MCFIYVLYMAQVSIPWLQLSSAARHCNVFISNSVGQMSLWVPLKADAYPAAGASHLLCCWAGCGQQARTRGRCSRRGRASHGPKLWSGTDWNQSRWIENLTSCVMGCLREEMTAWRARSSLRALRKMTMTTWGPWTTLTTFNSQMSLENYKEHTGKICNIDPITSSRSSIHRMQYIKK